MKCQGIGALLTMESKMDSPIYFTVTVDTEEEWDWNGPLPVTDLSTCIMELAAKLDESES